MSTTLPLPPTAELAAAAPSLRRLTIGRAVLALLWAAALVLATHGRVPSGAGVPTGAALVLASYPLIDVVASRRGAAIADARVLTVNAAISALAGVGIGVAAFGADAGTTLAVFGLWAAVSGAMQLGLAVHRRRTAGGQRSMILSGGLSTVAGLGFLATSRGDEIQLGTIAGYMALGAILFLLSARRRGPATPA